MKVLVLFCCFALARAGIIGTDYSPAAPVSTVYSSINSPVVTKTITPIAYKTYSTPAPVYESVLSTHESRTNSLDGTQHTFSKTLDTPYASVQKFDSRTAGHSTVYSTPTFHSGPIISQPHATFVSTPLTSPINYHTQAAPVFTKTVSSPGLSAYSSHNPVIQPQPAVKITYSEAPLVSHMTFTGLGTSYSW